MRRKVHPKERATNTPEQFCPFRHVLEKYVPFAEQRDNGKLNHLALPTITRWTFSFILSTAFFI